MQPTRVALWDGMAKQVPKGSTSQEVIALVETTLDRCLASPAELQTAQAEADANLPAHARAALDKTVALPSRSYRDAAIIQLAYGLTLKEMDHTRRQAGARTIASKVSKLFRKRHIAAVDDAYQNIGKNTVDLARGNEPDFDAVLKWANNAPANLRTIAFGLAVAKTAETARPVKTMPVLDSAKLTFPVMARLVGGLLSAPSGGAHEQFAVAAALEAAIEEIEGSGRLRVETKAVDRIRCELWRYRRHTVKARRED